MTRGMGGGRQSARDAARWPAEIHNPGGGVKLRVGLTLALFITVTFAVSAVGFWLHNRYAIAYWVFDLRSLGPFAGGLTVLALNRRLGLGVRWVPGLGFNVQLIRRSVLTAGVALAIVLSCVQFYTFFRWRMKPVDLPNVPHPLALPGDVGTISALVLVAMLIGLVLEEFGWRTVLEPTLRQRYNVVTTALVIGLIWGSWSWPLWQAGLDRLAGPGTLVEFVLFLGGVYVTCVSISLLLVLVHQRMRVGHWASSVAFRLVFGFGFFLILDEEQGRWQPMFAISLACATAALVGLYYYRRAALAQRARSARMNVSAPSADSPTAGAASSSQ